MTLPRRIASMNCSPDSMLGVELNAPIIESILFSLIFFFHSKKIPIGPGSGSGMVCLKRPHLERVEETVSEER